MSFMAVASGIGAVVGGVSSIVGANKSAKAQKAALAQSNALEREQMAEARRQFDTQRADLAPYREQGYVSLGQLGRGTADGGEFNRPFSMADFEQDPGYAFRRDEGLRAVDAGASARGGVLSGRNLKATQQYGQGLASQEFGNAFNRYQDDLTSRYNRLAGLAQTGQTAVNSGNDASRNLTLNLADGSRALSNNAQQLGNVRASQYGNNAGAIGSAASTIGGLFGGGFGGGGGGGGFRLDPSISATNNAWLNRGG